MSVEEIITLAKELPRADQVRIADALAETEYEKKEREFLKTIEGVREIPIWSPLASYEAAAALQELIDERKFDS